jgi:hypothetical protein
VLGLAASSTHIMRAGNWVDDQKFGQGVMHYASGDEYSGSWEHDVRSGWGTMHWASSKQRYEGWWAAGLPHGPGTHTWYQQLVTDASPTNHAALLQFNRCACHDTASLLAQDQDWPLCQCVHSWVMQASRQEFKCPYAHSSVARGITG